MKSKNCQRIWGLAFAILFLAVSHASAFYDPHVGRWISRDPIGEDGGRNVYGFVRNNPTGFVDAWGLYEIDVHYYLTFWLASKIPCFTDAEARRIANADQGTDENRNTKPGLGLLESQQEKNRKYHALHPASPAPNYLGVLWRSATEGEILDYSSIDSYFTSDAFLRIQMKKACDLDALGIYLHHLQDSFSHAGYTSDVYGHARGGFSPDKTANDYSKSAQMAAATWFALQEWVKTCRCQCYSDKIKNKNLFVAPMGQQLTAFLKAFGGPESRGISQDEIDKQMGILGVNPR